MNFLLWAFFLGGGGLEDLYIVYDLVSSKKSFAYQCKYYDLDKPQDERWNANAFSFLLWIPPKSMCSSLGTVCYISALWYTALITYVNVILNLNLYRGEFNAARCLQVQVKGGGSPIERVCLLQGRAEVQHKASPPSGKVPVRFLCVDQVEFISCELSKKK